MSKISLFLFILLFLPQITACGSATGSSSGGSGSTVGNGNSGGSGTGANGFTIQGKLSSINVSASLSLGKSVSHSGSVTHVLAVSPQLGDTSCKTSTVASDGTFKLSVTGKKPWAVFFLDSHNIGRNMFMGRFVTATLDTLVPTNQTGSSDLGTVTIDSVSGKATASKSYNDILADLSLDSSTASAIGSLDDVATRYENPDVDGDGEIDCDSSYKNFMLDFHVRFNMAVGGSNATINDVIDSFLSSSNTTATYANTGVYLAYSKNFSSSESGSVTFVDSAVTTSEGGSIPKNTATTSVTNNNFGDYKSFGPNIPNTSELPSGTIVFAVGDKTLTFAEVQTPTLAQLNASAGRIFPFIKFSKTDSTCTSNCTLSGISYKWMQKTSDGWEATTQTALDSIVVSKGGYISVRVGNDTNKTIGIAIPKSNLGGTITWKTANAILEGVSNSEFNSLVTTQLCHLGISYDDVLGMRYFEGINDAPGTCP